MNGHFKAKKIGGDCGYTSKGAEQVAILFQLVDGGDTYTWYGHFTDKTTENTLKTLAILGVENDLSNIGEPSDEEFTLVLQEEQDKETGEMRTKVRWVNKGDGVALKTRMDAGQRAQFAKRIAGGLTKAKRELGAAAPSNGTKAAAKSDADDSEIPF